ncbi:uncharacterized protein LOC113323489 [Papaver somniferum]|uniref:uncharacterized protein LOC113323489 n=1 Tax=Papaver somniferum TaxID=3469 RepID=UPI000E6FCA40|nr:uncharacterized protein LOC113323489 [Papaver somniferum]
MCFIESFFLCTTYILRCHLAKLHTDFYCLNCIVSIAENDSRRRHLDAVQRQVTTVCRNEEISVTNVWYLHGCRHSVPDGLMRLTDVMVDGKIVVPAGCRNG